MLGRTHIAIGIALSTFAAAAMPEAGSFWPGNYGDSAPETAVAGAAVVAAVIGGALGSAIPDIDTEPSDRRKEIAQSRVLAFAVVGAALICDLIFKLGICELVLARDKPGLMLGALIFALACIASRRSPHRAFSHSLVCMGIMAFGLSCIYRPLITYFVIGFASHLALDLMNKKRVQVFWPIGKGYCLRLCSADGLVNAVMFSAGVILTVINIVMAVAF